MSDYPPTRCPYCSRALYDTDACACTDPLDAECECCGEDFEIGCYDGDEADCPGCGRRWMTSVDADEWGLIDVDEDKPCECWAEWEVEA